MARGGFPAVIITLGVVAVVCAVLPVFFPGAIALGIIVIAGSIVTIRRSPPGTRWRGVLGLALGILALVGGLIWLVLWWVVNNAFSGF
jgi:hypothetical protein